MRDYSLEQAMRSDFERQVELHQEIVKRRQTSEAGRAERGSRFIRINDKKKNPEALISEAAQEALRLLVEDDADSLTQHLAKEKKRLGDAFYLENYRTQKGQSLIEFALLFDRPNSLKVLQNF